jgi:hypothetical protein
VSSPSLGPLGALLDPPTPWTEHRRFGGTVSVTDASPTWYEEYR